MYQIFTWTKYLRDIYYLCWRLSFTSMDTRKLLFEQVFSKFEKRAVLPWPLMEVINRRKWLCLYFFLNASGTMKSYSFDPSSKCPRREFNVFPESGRLMPIPFSHYKFGPERSIPLVDTLLGGIATFKLMVRWRAAVLAICSLHKMLSVFFLCILKKFENMDKE